MRLRKILLVGAALSALASTACAADADVDELVVTGARLDETLPQDLARYGADLETISPETLRRNLYVDVSSALQMQTAGLFLAPRNGPFSYADIALQGSRTGDVLWLVDGVRINNRLYTSTSPADTLPASMVERIEVLKGGQSLFYGTQAAAGVINVVTKPYSETFEGQITAGGHTNDGLHGDVMVRGPIGGGARFVGWVSKDYADGYKTFNVFQPSATDRRRGYDVQSFGGKLGADLSEGVSLNLYAQHTDARLEYPNPRLTRLSFNDRDEEIASASLDWKISDQAAISVKGYYHDWDSVYTTINNVPGNPAARVIVDNLTYWGYEDYGLAVLAKLNLHKGFEYELGYDYQNFNGRDEVLLIAEQTEKVHAFVAQVRTTDDLIENVRLAAGVRYNKTDEADKAVWNLSGRWDVTPAVYLEGMVGTSFILPSAEQLYGIDPCCAVGNPNLKAEESLNGNVSLGGQGGRFTWQVTGFARKIDDLIVDVYDLAAFPDGIYVNTADTVKSRGLEVLATAQLMDGLSARATFAYTRTRADGASRQFDRIPKTQAKGTLVYEPTDRAYGASASVLYVGDVFQTVTAFGRVNYGDYMVADVTAHVYVDGETRRHRLGARVENVFDEDYGTRVNSAVIDLSTQRFLYRFRGPPRTLHMSYTYSF